MCIKGTRVLPGSVMHYQPLYLPGCITSHCKGSTWIFYKLSGQEEWKTTKGSQQTHTVTQKSISRGSPPALSAALWSKADNFLGVLWKQLSLVKSFWTRQCVLNKMMILTDNSTYEIWRTHLLFLARLFSVSDTDIV